MPPGKRTMSHYSMDLVSHDFGYANSHQRGQPGDRKPETVGVAAGRRPGRRMRALALGPSNYFPAERW